MPPVNLPSPVPVARSHIRRSEELSFRHKRLRRELRWLPLDHHSCQTVAWPTVKNS